MSRPDGWKRSRSLWLLNELLLVSAVLGMSACGPDEPLRANTSAYRLSASMNVRSAPNTESRILTELPAGTIVHIEPVPGEEWGRLYTATGERLGFIYAVSSHLAPFDAVDIEPPSSRESQLLNELAPRCDDPPAEILAMADRMARTVPDQSGPTGRETLMKALLNATDPRGAPYDCRHAAFMIKEPR